MKKLFAVAVLAALLAACNKKDTVIQPDPAPPVMRYTSLKDLPIKFREQTQIDLDGDNVPDIGFATLYVGDGVLKRDKRQYYAHSAFNTSYFLNDEGQTPVLNSGNIIKTKNHSGYYWYNANSALLAEKIIPETGAFFWQGDWKNANHQYLSVQVAKGNGKYNGWVELSFKTDTEEIILHRAAISTEPGKDVVAGQ